MSYLASQNFVMVLILLTASDIKCKALSITQIFRNLEPLSLGDEYWNIRDAIVQTELLVLRMVAWQVTVNPVSPAFGVPSLRCPQPPASPASGVPSLRCPQPSNPKVSNRSLGIDWISGYKWGVYY